MSLTDKTSIRGITRQVIADYQINYWVAIFGCLLLSVVGAILVVNVGSTSPFPVEVGTVDAISTFPGAENIVAWPYYFMSYCLDLVIDNKLLAARLVSVWLGLVAVVSLWVCLRHWYSPRLAFLASIPLATNSWFLVVSSKAGPDSMVVAAPLLMAASWLAYSHRRQRARLIKYPIMVGLILSWFTPFLIWLVVGQLVFIIRRWFDFLKNQLLSKFMSVLTVTCLLGLTIWLSPKSFDLLGIGNYSFSLDSLVEVPVAFLWEAPTQPDRWLANLPMLDAFGLTALLTGGVILIVRLNRFDNIEKGLAIVIGLSWLVFVATSGGITSPAFGISLAIVGLMVGCGLGEMYSRWRTVFPINPLVKLVGVGLIGGLLSLSVIYQFQKHFIAWPRDPETIELRKSFLN